ncbi:MerR family transcriptional regulator [Streptomyces gobiensis]|uniref:MerR family transcriptional regulator n=1 Tax=Streptomyces gobiensis TaxID=2875706 RepID=UPI001E555D5C|nr:MerR family transcriptional regulator [Streptomyces gobiensis]UGY90525.1 MerR family transcriptional regulator [Streptomyces gobiensis]
MELPIDDVNAPLYTVGQVAAMLDVQVAFLRRLDEQGVVVPRRSAGGQRRYSRREISQVAEVIRLTREGLTLTGVRRVLALQARVEDLEADLAAARGGDERGDAEGDSVGQSTGDGS